MSDRPQPSELDCVIGTVTKNARESRGGLNALASDDGASLAAAGGRWSKLAARAIADRDLSATVVRDRKSTRLNSSHTIQSRMPSSA